MHEIDGNDERIAVFAPQAARRLRGELRISRFPARASEILQDQIGPLANLRSAAGCFLCVRTNSPRIDVLLRRLRHHQPVPQSLDCVVEQTDGTWLSSASVDLRPLDGDVRVSLFTGLERDRAAREVRIFLPCISTCVIAGLAISDDADFATGQVPKADFLALGDSLTQGFNVAHPTQTWVQRVAFRRGLHAWNLGLGGLKIEPAVHDWAIQRGDWRVIVVALGSNHAWRESDADHCSERAAMLLELLQPCLAQTQVLWVLPPWKPLENGLGPPDYMGVPLTAAAAKRVERVRADLAQILRSEPRITVVTDALPHQARWMPDGLHPEALATAAYADAIDAAMAE